MPSISSIALWAALAGTTTGIRRHQEAKAPSGMAISPPNPEDIKSLVETAAEINDTFDQAARETDVVRGDYWGRDGVCVGGRICLNYKDAGSCEDNIFDCIWVKAFCGHCTGDRPNSLCRTIKKQGECVVSIFDCEWESDDYCDDDGDYDNDYDRRRADRRRRETDVVRDSTTTTTNKEYICGKQDCGGCPFCGRCEPWCLQKHTSGFPSGFCKGGPTCNGRNQMQCQLMFFDCTWEIGLPSWDRGSCGKQDCASCPFCGNRCEPWCLHGLR